MIKFDNEVAYENIVDFQSVGVRIKVLVGDWDAGKRADFVEYVTARMNTPPTLHGEEVTWTPLTAAGRTKLFLSVAITCDGQ